MGGHLHEGLTTHDFHPQPCINPRDIFPSRSRQSNRSFNSRTSSSRRQVKPRSPLANNDQCQDGCCSDDDNIGSKSRSKAHDCCADFCDDALFDLGDFGDLELPDCCTETACLSPAKSSHSPVDDCEECQEECDECIEEHKDCDEVIDLGLDDCAPCLDEHVKQCDKPSSACNDDCEDCDFSCVDCFDFDWTQFSQDKSVSLSHPMPFLNSTSITENIPSTFVPLDLNDAGIWNDFSSSTDLAAAPLDLPMHHQCFNPSMTGQNDLWRNPLCDFGPGTSQVTSTASMMPATANLTTFPYGCHPATAHQFSVNGNSIQLQAWGDRVPSQPSQALTTSNTTSDGMAAQQRLPALPSIRSKIKLEVGQPTPPQKPPNMRVCEWLMPCGTKCDATFASTTDLKKHVKALHMTKGTTTCRWAECTASFGSEAALTGHISKKHLLNNSSTNNNPCTSNDPSATDLNQSTDGEGPFKCTFPGCRKSFMYKQVRDEHVASTHNNERQYCHICKQYLNGEGSNFRRHMASHQPKHTHMLCKFHHLGCKKRFPRLDNLRRHEACCKFGKRLASGAFGGDSPAASVSSGASGLQARYVSPEDKFGLIDSSVEVAGHHHHHHHHHHDHSHPHPHLHPHPHAHPLQHEHAHPHAHMYGHGHVHPHTHAMAHPYGH